MKNQIRICTNCNSYTLKDDCKRCNRKTKSCHPARYSPDDKYLRYRIKENYSS